MKKIIKLTESELHKMIRKCVNEAYYYPYGVKTFVSCVEKFLANADDILINLKNECEEGDEGLRQVIQIGSTLLDNVHYAKEEIKDVSHLQPVSYYKD